LRATPAVIAFLSFINFEFFRTEFRRALLRGRLHMSAADPPLAGEGQRAAGRLITARRFSTPRQSSERGPRAHRSGAG
jgi:hypothetical protein